MNRILLIVLILLAFASGTLYAQKDLSEGRSSRFPEPVGQKDKESSCIKCHTGLDDRLRESVIITKTSVHAKSNCHICHGGNPNSADKKIAMGSDALFIGRPDNKVVTDFCGRGGCHFSEISQFKKGPHYDSVLKKGRPSCLYCHGSHNIQKSSVQIIQSARCDECHTANYARDILGSMTIIQSGIDSVRNNIFYLDQKHADTAALAERLSNTKNIFIDLVHVFSKDKLDSTKRIMELDLQNLQNESRQLVDLSKRLDLLYIIMMVIGLSIVVAFALYMIFMISRRHGTEQN